jgi:hypothetical protein
MTIDTTTDLYESSKALQVMYQVIYNGWRNDEEFLLKQILRLEDGNSLLTTICGGASDNESLKMVSF